MMALTASKDDLVGIDSRVDAILDAFGLRREADVIVGTPVQRGLSGGQKRRLSVASQVICAPKVLFLDEPTSGLDSVASFEIISHLRAVARANKVSWFLASLKADYDHRLDTPAVYEDIRSL